jgi:tetratricopeptide (TPR) repeat protein
MRQSALIVFTALLMIAACSRHAAPPDSTDNIPPTGWAGLELRLFAPGLEAKGERPALLEFGSLLLLEVVVDSLEAVRAVNARGGTRPGPPEAPLPSVVIDDDDAWEARVAFQVTDFAGEAALAETLWAEALHRGATTPSGRAAGFSVQRATWVLTPEALSGLQPGDYRFTATLAAPGGGAEPLVSKGLYISLRAADTGQTGATLYAQAKALELSGNWQQALDAAQRALTADPELYDAMEVVAKSHLQLGNRTIAIEWYERYIDTFSDQNDRDGYPQILRSFVESLRTQ